MIPIDPAWDLDGESMISAAVLTVTLRAFTVKTEEKSAQLVWETATEVNFSHFIVERSTDAAEWEELGRQTGGQTRYAYTDKNAFDGYGTELYYRLRIVDLDGSVQYSPVRRVTYTAAKKIDIYPNPTGGSLFFGKNGVRLTQTEIFDAGGNLLQSIPGDISQIETADLPKGVYYLRLLSADNTVTEEVFVRE